jgi:2-C-methyl-D-erythritol 4-phosphate cytidylyltransferase
MTVGSIILVSDAEAASRSFLGAPVVIRALASTLLPREEVSVVVVAPASLEPLLRREADRFGFTELHAVLEPGEDQLAGLARALEALPPVDHVIIQDGLTALCPVAQVVRVLQASRTTGAAVCVTQPVGTVFFDAEELRERVAGAVCISQMPAAFRRDTLQDLCTRAAAPEVLAAAAEAGVALARVAGDPDVFPIQDGAALTRALEVWGRRAAEFVFVWPRAGAPAATSVPSPGAALNLTIPEHPAG